MIDIDAQKAITKLYMEHSDLMQEYADCLKKDDVFEIKRKLLKRMGAIEHEIKRLSLEQRDFYRLLGNY